jgi:hypothetical protein
MGPRRWLLAGVVASALVSSVGTPVVAEERAPTPALDAPVPQAAIDAAVSRGVAWLRSQQEPGGGFGTHAGETSLALLALRYSSIAPEDPACKRAVRVLVRDLPDGTSYGASLGVVALLSQGGEACRAKAEELAGDLVRAQCENGQWSYSAKRSSRASAGDNSNTQLAVLALAAARARGIDVPRETFEKCLAYLRATQNADGGWGYSAKERRASYASMTAGCAMSVALCLGTPPAGGAKRAEDAGVTRAVAWLGERFEPGSNTGAADAFGGRKGRRGDEFWRHYWLWSVERACSVAGAERLGRHEWYQEGARHLIGAQRDDGSWLGPERDVVATCFALLFFARGTLRVVTPSEPPVVVVTPR